MSLLERLLPAIGDVINDRYELRDELGRGGFGVVYRATQRGINEDVAIKILLPHVLEVEDVAERFDREVTVAKGLRHPNTIRILDAAKTEKGLPYYVMEFVKGVSLDRLIEESGPLSPARTRRIGTQILKSLGEAHARGVVHRDLKPANIILTEIYGEDDFVKVLDFGIAKALTGEASMHMTSTGMVLGTPAYMSPEQALGKRDLDGRSDIYAVGLILAECLSSQPVVKGETPYLVVAQHATTQPLQFLPALTQTPIWPVIERATRKNRDERYRDATEMREALQALGPLPEEISAEFSGPWATVPISTSDPFMTPAPHTPSSLSGQMASGQASGQMAAGADSGMIMGGDHRAKTMAAPSGQIEIEAPKRGAARAIAILVVLALIIGGVIFAVVGGGSGNGSQSDSGEAGLARGDTDLPLNLPASPSAERGATPTEETGQVAARETGTPSAGADERATDSATVQSALAAARDGVARSVPETRPIQFDGFGVTVLNGDETLGQTPFQIPAPRIDAQLELHFERDGYRSETRSVSLLDDRVFVELDRRRTSSREERAERSEHERSTRSESSRSESSGTESSGSSETSEEHEQTTTTSPFGQTQIHD